MKNKSSLAQISRKFKSRKEMPSWMKIDLALGQQIRVLREALGMTQKQLADKARMYQVDIANIEEGRRKDLQVSTISRIAEALNCEIPISLIPKEEIAGFVEKKALAKAEKMVAASSANMAMELQKPSRQVIEDQISEMKEEIVRKKRFLLWEEDEK